MRGPVSVSTVAFDGYPLDVALAAIAGCGARFAELAYIQGYGAFDESAFADAAATEARARLAAAGLASVAVSAHIDLGIEGALEQLRRRVSFAHGIGARILITNAGRRGAATAIMRTVEAVLPDCAAADVTLALENPGHGADALFGKGSDGAALAEAFASPHLGLNYDAGNILSYSNGALHPETDVGDAAPFIRHVHLKDFREDGPDWRFTALGDGLIDIAAVGHVLSGSMPGVPVGLELPLRLRRPDHGDPVRDLSPVPLDLAVQAIRRSLGRWTATTA